MGALSVLSLASNNLGAIVGWTHSPVHRAEYRYTHSDGRHQEQLPDGDELGRPDGIIAIVNAIPDMGALSVLSLKGNYLRAEGGKALAEGLKGNQVITELNIADNYLGINSTNEGATSGVIAIADVIPGMGAMTILNMSENGLQGAEAGKALGDALAGNTVLKELDLSGEEYSPSMDIEFVKAFTPGLSDNGAMTKFDISSNSLRAEGTKLLAAALKGNQIVTELNISSNQMTFNGTTWGEMSGVIALADAIPDMRATTELNLTKNFLLMGDAIIILRAVEHNESLICIDLSYNQIFGDCSRESTAALITQMSKAKHVDISLQGVTYMHATLQELQNAGVTKIKGLNSDHLQLISKVDLPDEQYADIHPSENKGIRIASQVPDNHDALSDLDFAAILQDMRQTEAAWWSAHEDVPVQGAPFHANEDLSLVLAPIHANTGQ